jgi:hypothetical protein
VTHGGPGTQAAGGGGSGGGAVGAGQGQSPGDASGQEKEGGTARESDVVDGHPRDFGRYREDLWAKEDEKKRQEQQAKEKEEKDKEDERPIGNEGERRVPSSSDHGFHEWEKEEMEALLGEVRGTLGRPSFRPFRLGSILIISHVLDEILGGGRSRKQLLVQCRLSRSSTGVRADGIVRQDLTPSYFRLINSCTLVRHGSRYHSYPFSHLLMTLNTRASHILPRPFTPN